MAEEILYDQLGTTEQDPIPKPKLSEQQKVKLDSIVQKMISNKESDANIKMVVDDFKQLYSGRQSEQQMQQAKQEPPAFQIQLTQPTFGATPATMVTQPSTPNEKINIPKEQVSYIPDEKTYEIQKQSGKARVAHEKVNAALVSSDAQYEKKLRESRKDNYNIESLRNEYKQRGQILSPQDEQGLLQKEKERQYNLPITTEQLSDFKTGTILTPALSRKFVKDLNDKDVSESAYQVDKFNEIANDPDPYAHKRIEKINENAKNIKKGHLIYDPESKVLIKPLGLVGSIIEGTTNKFKADEEHDFLKNTVNDAAIISQLEDERNNPDRDEPVKVPRGKVNEALKAISEMPLMPIVAGVAGTVGGTFIGNPELGTVAATALGAYENRKAQYRETFKQVYNELRDQGKPKFDALSEARKQAENAQEIGTIVGGAQGLIGAKIGNIPIKGTNFNLGFQQAIGDFLKKNGNEFGKIALDAVAQGGLAASGEMAKNKLAQAAGIKREIDSGTGDAFWGNVFMSGAIGAALKMGRGISSVNYKKILSGLTRNVPEETISGTLQEKVASGEITQQAADQALQEINSYKEKDAQIPPSVTEEARFKIQDNIDKINELEKQKEATHSSLQGPIKEKIDKLIEDNLALAKETEKAPKSESGLDKSKEKEAIDFAHELVDEGVLPDTYWEDVKKDPIKFWQTIAQQAQNRDKNWKPLGQPIDEQTVRDNYGDTVVDYAKELFPAPEITESKISVIQPGEIKHPETITIKPKENAIPERSAETANVGEAPGHSQEVGTGIPESGEAPNAQTEGGTPQAEGANTGQEEVGGSKVPPTGKGADVSSYGEGGKELDKLANNIPDSGKVAEYMSKDTIEKYTGETPTNDQSRDIQELEIALNHGEKIIEKAKELFGKDYAEKSIDYIDNSTAGVSNKALMYVSLENALGKEKLAHPERAAEIAKQQALVYAKSQAFARENSLALNYQKLRRIAKVGYDIDKVTENFFSPEEREGRRSISKAVEADPDSINKAAEETEAGVIDPAIENAVKAGVAKEIDAIYNRLPKEKKTLADKAISALDKIHDKLRGKTYESTLGIPVAIIDGAVLTIRNAIKAGVKIADAVEMGIAKVKEKYNDWAKEDEFRKDVISGLREQGAVDATEGKSTIDRLKVAENNLQKRIDEIREEIIKGEREVKESKGKLQSKKLDQLRDQKKALEGLRDKYLPKEDLYKDEKAIKATEKKLINENIELNRQIAKGEKDKAEAKVTPESESIGKLKAERDARKAILEALDPTPKDYVKKALIEQGFGREKVIKGEKKQILDWKKLAGAAGTTSKISENVGKVLEKDGFTEPQLERIKDAFIQEYVDLRTSVIEKAQNELAKRNKEAITPEQKTAARKLAELYTYGLFDSQPDAFENLLNKALGTKVSEKGFNEAREIAKGLETLYSSSFKGKKLNDISAKTAIQQLEDRMRLLLFSEAKNQGNFNLRAAQIVRNYFDLQQTMILNNLKQAVENPLSGMQQNIIDKITGMTSKEGIGTPEMAAQRRGLMKDIYKDMMLNGSIGYGKVESAFVNRAHIDDYINKLSDNKLYHGVMSVLSGKATLNAVDAMYKAGITEKKFAGNLIKLLTHETNANRMSKADAVTFVSEKLTGQTLADAKVSAKEIIEKVNKDANKELIPNNPESINRFANDIVKAALEMGGNITTEQITAAYNAAYKAAGLGLGHEANNILSSTVHDYSAKLESRINDAIKAKEWNRAALLTAQSILFRNVLNPFVGGGTNWIVLKFEKTGLGLLTGLGYRLGSSTRIDMSTEAGMKVLEKRLYNQARIKDNYMRGLVGGAASALTYIGFMGLSNTDEYREWRGKNMWAARYLDMITPEMLLTEMAVKNKEVKKYLSATLNKNDAFDATTKVIKAGDFAIKGESDKAKGAIGEAIGSKFNTPLPWRLVKDGRVIYQGVTGQDPYHANYKPSTGFLNGVFQGGAIEWLGLRPEGGAGSSNSSESSGTSKKTNKGSKPKKPTKK